MLGYLFSIVAGAFGGYLLHAVSMKVNFKQRTIENKIKVYDAVIGLWARMRNFIFHELMPRRSSPNVMMEFDKVYGESQAFMGEAVLVSEDQKLAEDINALNEQFYRTGWLDLSHEQVNATMEDMKIRAFDVIKRMREDIKKSTVLERSDLIHIWGGIKNTPPDEKVKC